MGLKTAETEQNGSKSPKTGLFDTSKMVKPLGHVPEGGGARPLEGHTLNELLELRAAIDALLPAVKLSDVDLEEELMLQFARTKGLYDAVVKDENTPANQRAQVANSCTAILEQLIKMQKALYGAERMKALEQTLIRTLKQFPDDVQAKFFELYERALTAINLPAPTTTGTPT